MTEGEFWKSIDHTAEDEEKGKIFLQYRGLDAHIYVLDYLKSMKSGTISYAEISTAIRYDKRIRRIVYKYVGFLEEYIRAYIANKYRDNIGEFPHTEIVDKRLKENDNSLFLALENTDLGKLIKQVQKLSKCDKGELFSHCKYTLKSLEAIRVLRNQVGHNRFLLNNLLLVAPKGDNASLYANIKNLFNYLPAKLKNGFKKEIEEAQYSKVPKKDYQTDWSLVEGIAVIIN